MNTSTKWISSIIVVLLVGTLLFGSATKAQAYVVDNTGRVESDEVIDDDVLLFNNSVLMNGKVNGTLVAGGQDVVLNGTVTGDAILMGRTITIGQNAVIQGNLFTGAQVVNISGKVLGSVFSGSMSTVVKDSADVTRNFYFGGYSLDIAQGASIQKDLAAGGYQVIQDGTVERDVNADVGAYQLTGTVGRNFSVTVSSPSQNKPATPMSFGSQADMPATINTGLTIAESAKIGGNLNYTSTIPQDNTIQSKPAGTVIFSTPVPQSGQTASQQPDRQFRNYFAVGFGKGLVNMARNLISIYLIGVLALWLVPGVVKKMADTVEQKPLPSAGYGSLVFIVGWAGAFAAGLAIVALAIILGIISLGGLGGITFWTGTTLLTAFLTAFVLMINLGSKVVIAYLVGNWLLQKMTKQTETNRFVALLLGVVIYVLLRAIPVFGWLIAMIVILLGLGAAWFYVQSLRKTVAPVTVA
jgi:hypothetical protein